MATIRVIEWDHTGIPDRATTKDYDSAETAAEAMGIDAGDLEAAIEEFGRCDTEFHTAWEPESEDEEFPQAEAP